MASDRTHDGQRSDVPKEGSANPETLRVLLVEDSATDAKLIIQELQRTKGHISFERVETGEGMEAALGRQAWDVVISDWSMPKFSAMAALRHLKKGKLDF